MVFRGKMDAPPCAVEQNLWKAPRPIRLPAYLPTGKGLAIYSVNMINIPRASSEVAKPHSMLQSLCGILLMKPLDVKLSESAKG